MTTAAQPTPGSRPPLKRWTAAEFDRLVELGAFDGQRIELINGELLEMPEMNDPHAHAVRLTQYALLPIFPPNAWTISVQCPMRLPSGSRPQPDFAIVWGTPREITLHPTTAALVIEVADTTIDFDRAEKAELYARNLIPEYWILNLRARCLEVHRRPVRNESGTWRYEDVQTIAENGSISPLSAPGSMIKVADILP